MIEGPFLRSANTVPARVPMAASCWLSVAPGRKICPAPTNRNFTSPSSMTSPASMMPPAQVGTVDAHSVARPLVHDLEAPLSEGVDLAVKPRHRVVIDGDARVLGAPHGE